MSQRRIQIRIQIRKYLCKGYGVTRKDGLHRILLLCCKAEVLSFLLRHISWILSDHGDFPKKTAPFPKRRFTPCFTDKKQAPAENAFASRKETCIFQGVYAIWLSFAAC